jgi:pimeloyl-ACP methyl ester carboxylesterase
VGATDLAVVDEGSGTAFFWGHGFGSSASQESSALLGWDRLAARHRVVRWDAPGHGASAGTPDPAEYRWDRLGRAVIGLADALGVDRFATGGVSMGAAGALWTAVQAPGRVTGLVLALPPTAYETRAADDYRAHADLVEREGVGAYVAEMRKEPLPAILRDIADAYDYTPMVADDLFPAVLRGAGDSDLPPVEQLRTIAVPALILAWVDDPGHPLSTAELLAATLPQAELHVARDLGDVLGWTERVETLLDRVAAQ